MARYGKPSAAEIIGTLIGAFIGALIVLGIVFGLDCMAAQFVIWTLNGYHVVSGFWHAFYAVVTLEFIVSLAAGGGSKLVK